MFIFHLCFVHFSLEERLIDEIYESSHLCFYNFSHFTEKRGVCVSVVSRPRSSELCYRDFNILLTDAVAVKRLMRIYNCQYVSREIEFLEIGTKVKILKGSAI